MRYFGGCDAGSTYTKCVIIDENSEIVASVINKSRINPVLSAQSALDEGAVRGDSRNTPHDVDAPPSPYRRYDERAGRGLRFRRI